VTRARAFTFSMLRPVMLTLAPASIRENTAPRAAPPLPATRTVDFRELHLLCHRSGDAVDIGVGPAPFAGLLPYRIDRADASRQRIDRIQIAA
jgi:hypothetical protein